MEIPSNRVYDILKAKGVTHLHHADSVITSYQFLRNQALLSRGTIERRMLYQTVQTSDETDKACGIWFDVFADSVDIHNRTKGINAYGPVLLVLDIELMRKAYTGKVWVTKLNPTKWEGTKHQDRWLTSPGDLEENFVKGRFDHMIVFRHAGGELPIRKYRQKIILDDPSLKSKLKIDYYSMAFGALKLSITEGGLDVPIEKRKCLMGCRCIEDYHADKDRTKLMYLPKA